MPPDAPAPPILFPDSAGDFSIGLRPIAAGDWFQGGEADPAVRKDPLFAAHRDIVWGELEGSRPGQVEALCLVADSIGAPCGALDWPPLYTAARLVADDLCLMEPGSDGWRLAALSLSAGTYFTAAEALGKSLTALHDPVPGFADRFLSRVTRIFDNLPPDTILERRNWTVTNEGGLFAPDADAVRARIAGILPEAAGDALHVRSERQTLRRLPRTGGALFTIRIWSRSLTEIGAENVLAERFAAAWRGVSAEFAAYKHLGLYTPLVESWLRARGE